MSLMLGKVPNLQTFQKELHDAFPFCVDRNSCLISDLMTHVKFLYEIIHICTAVVDESEI